MDRHTFLLERLPLEPCDEYPSGVPGCTLTANRQEVTAAFCAQNVADYEEGGLTYTTVKVTLQ